MKKIFLGLLFVSPAFALDMSQMVPVSCVPYGEIGTGYTPGRGGQVFNVDIQTKCGKGKFCYAESTCSYVDKTVVEKEYGGNLAKASQGEMTLKNVVKSWFEKDGTNPRYISSRVVAGCFSNDSGECPPALECLKDKNVSNATLGEFDRPKTPLNLNKPDAATR